MTMTPADLFAVPGVPESTFDVSSSPDLPASAPPAPWNCTSTGIVWLSRGGSRALAVAASSLARGARAPVVIGGLISYASTPVGTYHEVFGGVALRTGRDVAVTIPFMAVDSRDSVVGGRQNWSLPKVLARFTGEPTELAMTAEGDGWTVRVTARPIAPRLPVKTTGRVVQAWPDGSVRSAVLTGRASSRPALVSVEVRSNGNLAAWLRPGRHLGAVMTGTEFTLPDPR
jgi:Acetoacetate decarboxylase (ADC)